MEKVTEHPYPPLIFSFLCNHKKTFVVVKMEEKMKMNNSSKNKKVILKYSYQYKLLV